MAVCYWATETGTVGQSDRRATKRRRQDPLSRGSQTSQAGGHAKERRTRVRTAASHKELPSDLTICTGPVAFSTSVFSSMSRGHCRDWGKHCMFIRTGGCSPLRGAKCSKARLSSPYHKKAPIILEHRD